MSEISSAFRPDIQGLRALAVALVVLAHAGIPGFAGGIVGVDVFFVISGYLITRLLVGEKIRTGQISYLGFLAKRLKRLLPALITMLVTTTVLGVLLLTNHEFSEQTRSTPFAATWSSNFYFAFADFDYFAELRQKDLYLHTWSLGVEEQFYLVWPAVIAIAFLVKTDQARTSHRSLSGILVVLLIASFVLSMYWSADNTLYAFYMTPARAWEFALGGLIFLHTPTGDSPQAPLFARWGSSLQALGVSLILGITITLPEQATYPSAWATVPTIGAALVIMGGAHERTKNRRRLLAHPALVWVGDRSYSWYLWHWPLLMLGFAYGLENHLSAVPALVVLSLLIASVSYERVELPFWKGYRSDLAPVTTLLTSAVVIAVSSIAFAFLNAAHTKPQSQAAVVAGAIRNDMPDIYRRGCDRFFRDDLVNPCISGAQDGTRTVALIGDSIAGQWYSVLPLLFDPTTWKIVVLTKSSCAIVEAKNPNIKNQQSHDTCARWRHKAIDFLAELQPDVVFVGNSPRYEFTKDEWIKGSQVVLNRLTPAVGQVVFLEGTPQLSFDGPSCLERWLNEQPSPKPPNHAVCLDSKASENNATTRNLVAATAGFDNAHVLKLVDLVCPDATCSGWSSSGHAVFRDRQHLTNTFAKAQASFIRERLERMGIKLR